MTSDERRKDIVIMLNNSKASITGSKLASVYKVTRQVIVQDIAILRATGHDIIATPQGYLIPKYNGVQRARRVYAVKHDQDEIKDELFTMVDLGGEILDVIIEHAVYGEFKGQLALSSRSDVEEYLALMLDEKAEPLSALTGGIHLHTVEADSNSILDSIGKALKEKGYLLE